MASREERERAADLRAQEKPADPPKVGMQSPGYIRAVHPEHGEDVVFVPGELLPQWAADALQAGHGRSEGRHVVLDSEGGAS